MGGWGRGAGGRPGHLYDMTMKLKESKFRSLQVFEPITTCKMSLLPQSVDKDKSQIQKEGKQTIPLDGNVNKWR